MNIAAGNFDYVRQLADKLAGIVVEENKEYLVDSRLRFMAEQAGFSNTDAYLTNLLKTGRVPHEIETDIVDAMTTNETYFFRDDHPFSAIQTKLLPSLIEKNQATKRLDIWCAACSTGQEPYTIAMIIREHFPELADWKINIFATDISPTAIAKAREGVYTQFEMGRGLPAIYQLNYFTQRGDNWQVNQEIRDSVVYRELNLINPWNGIWTFDLILIRNVLIYFSEETKTEILDRMTDQLIPDGFLLLGSTESSMHLSRSFRSVIVGRTMAYQRKTDL